MPRNNFCPECRGMVDDDDMAVDGVCIYCTVGVGDSMMGGNVFGLDKAGEYPADSDEESKSDDTA